MVDGVILSSLRSATRKDNDSHSPTPWTHPRDIFSQFMSYKKCLLRVSTICLKDLSPVQSVLTFKQVLNSGRDTSVERLALPHGLALGGHEWSFHSRVSSSIYYWFLLSALFPLHPPICSFYTTFLCLFPYLSSRTVDGFRGSEKSRKVFLKEMPSCFKEFTPCYEGKLEMNLEKTGSAKRRDQSPVPTLLLLLLFWILDIEKSRMAWWPSSTFQT